MKNNTKNIPSVDKPKPKGSSDRSFGLVFVVVFSFIGLAPLLNSNPFRLWSLIIAAVLLLIALVIPKLLHPFNVAWLFFGSVLHRIMTPLILGVVFFLAITPIAILLKILRIDTLNRKFDKEAKSYWIYREPPGPEPESMKQQF